VLFRTSTRPTLNPLLLIHVSHVCISIHPEGKLCSDVGRVHVLNDPHDGSDGTDVNACDVSAAGRHLVTVGRRSSTIIELIDPCL